MESFKGLSLQQISKNTLSQLLTRLVTTTVTFIGIFIITYFQGFEFLGQISKVMAFVTFFYLLTDFGFNVMFLKYYFSATQKYLPNLVLLRILISVTLAIFAVLIASILPYNPTTDTGYNISEKIGISLFSLTIITYATSLSLSALLQKKLKYQLSIIPSILSGFVLLTGIFLGSKTGSLHAILMSYVLAQGIYITLLYKKLSKEYRLKTITAEFKEFSVFMLKVSSPLALILFLNVLLTKSDMFILALLKPSFDVGTYSFSYRIFDFLIIIPSFLTASMYPILLKKEQTGELINSIKRYAVLLFISSIILTSILFTASPLLKYVRGDFSLSVAPLQILSFALPFFFLTSLMQLVLIIKGKMKILAGIYSLALTVSIVLNITYIPYFSYFAAASITVIAEGVVFVCMVIYFIMQQTKIFQNKR